MELAVLFKKASSLPLDPGVYIMRNKAQEIIYIGKAKRLRVRVSSYFREGASHEEKVARMIVQVQDFDVIVTDSEFEALVLECSLIKRHKPKYNILLKDDKGFSYIRITSETYPRISAALQKYNDGAKYIGPYTSSFAVKRMVETANTAFKLPTCSRRFPETFGKYRPCLNYHIGRCSAVCSGKISEADYARTVTGALELLTKGTDSMLKKLYADMQTASDNLEFEHAAECRDSINAIERINTKQKIVTAKHPDADVFAFAANESCVLAAVLKYRGCVLSDKNEYPIYDTTDITEARNELLSVYYADNDDIPAEIVVDADFEDRALVERMASEKRGTRATVVIPQKGDLLSTVNMAYENAAESLKRRFERLSKEQSSLAELANLLGLTSVPETIEAYDISNYNDDAVAGMVVYKNGKPKKSDYRRFKIKTVDGTDDYASMREVLSRRIARYDDKKSEGSFAVKPDLLLLDGGKGHVSAVWELVRETSFSDVPLFGMVKDDKHRTRGIVGLEGEISIPLNGNAFRFLSGVQNEVHRYSLEFRRASHSKAAVRSSLLKINGVGEYLAKQLMLEFKTVAAVKLASVDALLAVNGMSRRTAQTIYNYFHSQD